MRPPATWQDPERRRHWGIALLQKGLQRVKVARLLQQILQDGASNSDQRQLLHYLTVSRASKCQSFPKCLQARASSTMFHSFLAFPNG